VSPSRRRKPAARRNQRGRSAPTRDFWGAGVGAEPKLPAIRPSEHPTALIHSLGALPFPGGEVASHYFDAVYERAAALALALAAAADLLEMSDESNEEAASPTTG
jgi:hypothetical protein